MHAHRIDLLAVLIGLTSVVFSSALGAQSPPTPLAVWPFDACEYETVNGASDALGQYNGTYTNGAATTDSGKLCRSLTLDGQDDYVALPGDFPNFSGENDFTIMAWIKAEWTDGEQNDMRIVVDDQHGSGGYGLSLGDGGNGRVRFFTRGANPTYIDTDAVIEQGQWHHIAIVHQNINKNKGKRWLAVDGQWAAKDNSPYSGSWSADPGQASIGGELAAGSEGTPRWRFQGQIDEVKVYPEALNLGQIKTLYDQDNDHQNWDGSARVCQPCAAAEYHFDACSYPAAASEASGSITDSSGNGFHGTPINGLASQPGKRCRAGYFNGTDQYVEIDDQSAFEDTSYLTLMAWIYPEEIHQHNGTNARGIMAKREGPSTEEAFGLFFWNGHGNNLWVDIDGTDNRFASNASFAPNEWRHIAVVFDGTLPKNERVKVYVDGTLDQVERENSTFIPDYNSNLYLGNLYYGDNQLKVFKGLLDEVRVIGKALTAAEIRATYLTSRLCPDCDADLHHLRLAHDGAMLICQAETIHFNACADAACNQIYTDPVELSLSPSGWVGGATRTLQFPPDGSGLSLRLRHTEPAAITLGMSAQPPPSAHPPLRCSNSSNPDAPCTLQVNDAGLEIDVDSGRACTNLAGTIRAEGCGGASGDFADQTKAIEFWFTYADPDSGARVPTINGHALPVNTPAEAIDLDFDTAATADFELRYPDAGRLDVFARYEGSAEEAGLVLEGSTAGGFVTAPAHFASEASNSEGASLENTNPAGGTVQAAGEDFTLAVEAKCANGDVTPNFAEIVALLLTDFAPSQGHVGTLTPARIDRADFSGGRATLSMAYSEVGHLRLQARTANYLGSGLDILAGDAGNGIAIGRFVPHHFRLSRGELSHRFETGCPAAEFTYLDETLSFDYDLIAKNATGQTTRNYIDAYSHFAGSGAVAFDPDTAADYSVVAIDEPAGAAVALTPRIHALAASQIGSWESGAGSFDVRLKIARDNTAKGPFDDTRFGVFVRDADGVELSGLDLDGDADGMADHTQAVTAAQLQHGRLRLIPAHGSEQADLYVPVIAEYFNGTAFVRQARDHCTRFDLDSHLKLIGKASAAATGTDPVPLAGADSSGSTHMQADVPLNQGEGQLGLSAPASGNTGHVTVETLLSHFPYLQYDWDGDGSRENATTQAVFGIHRGSDAIIFRQETTWH